VHGDEDDVVAVSDVVRGVHVELVARLAELDEVAALAPGEEELVPANGSLDVGVCVLLVDEAGEDAALVGADLRHDHLGRLHVVRGEPRISCVARVAKHVVGGVLVQVQRPPMRGGRGGAVLPLHELPLVEGVAHNLRDGHALDADAALLVVGEPLRPDSRVAAGVQAVNDLDGDERELLRRYLALVSLRHEQLERAGRRGAGLRMVCRSAHRC